MHNANITLDPATIGPSGGSMMATYDVMNVNVLVESSIFSSKPKVLTINIVPRASKKKGLIMLQAYCYL